MLSSTIPALRALAAWKRSAWKRLINIDLWSVICGYRFLSRCSTFKVVVIGAISSAGLLGLVLCRHLNGLATLIFTVVIFADTWEKA